jgi:hypothetical protein
VGGGGGGREGERIKEGNEGRGRGGRAQLSPTNPPLAHSRVQKRGGRGREGEGEGEGAGEGRVGGRGGKGGRQNL